MEALVDVTALCLEFLCEFHLYNDLQWLSCEFKVILLELNLMIPQCNTWSEFRLSSKRSERSKKQRWPQELRPWAWNQQKMDFMENTELVQTSWNLTEVLQPFKNPHMGRFSYSNIHDLLKKPSPGDPLEPVGPTSLDLLSATRGSNSARPCWAASGHRRRRKWSRPFGWPGGLGGWKGEVGLEVWEWGIRRYQGMYEYNLSS